MKLTIIRVLLLSLMILVLCYDIAQAQEHKWQVGVAVAPALTWQHYFAQSDSTAAGQEAEESNSLMEKRLGYALRLRVGYRISPRFEIVMGASFSRKGGQTRDITYNPGAINGEAVVNLSQSYSYDHYFVSVPIEATYHFKIGTQQFYAGAGISTDFYQETRTINEIKERSDGSSGTEKSMYKVPLYRDVLASGMVSLGYEHTLSDRLTMQVGPEFLFPILGMLEPKYAFVNHRLYAMQFNFSINYSF